MKLMTCNIKFRKKYQRDKKYKRKELRGKTGQRIQLKK